MCRQSAASFHRPGGLWTDGLEELATDLGASLFSVAHALFEVRAGGHTFGNAGILLQIVRGV